MSNNEQEAYAAANLREMLRDVDLSESREAYPHAGLVTDDRRQQVLNQLALACDGDISESEAYRDLVQPSGTETITEAVQSGNVSQMQYAVGLVDHTEDGQEAKTRLARELASEGCIGLVVGPPGAGKTATALDTARIWKALTGGTVVSNVTKWDGTDEVVESSGEMLEAMQAVDGQVLALIDEAAQNLTSRGEDQARTNQLVKDLKLIRKKEDGDRFAKRGSFLAIGHTRRDTAAELRRLTSVVLEKPSRQDPGRAKLYSSQGGRDALELEAEYKGLADTPENYDEHEPSPFVVTVEEDDDQEDGGDDQERQQAIRTALRAVKPWADDAGLSYRDAGDIAGYSAGWVSDRVAEWNEGQHRNLVNDPTA
ncbi:AAA family ATPase [Halobacteriales archaeon Cl-PHB]